MPVIPLHVALDALRNGDITVHEYRLMRGLAVVDEDDLARACASGAPAEMPEPTEPEDAITGTDGESYSRRRWWRRTAAPPRPISETDSNGRTPS